MDGLLILLLIGWIISQMKKGKKKSPKKAAPKKAPTFLDQVVKAATEDDPLLKGFVQAFSGKEEKKPHTIASNHQQLAEGESHMSQTNIYDVADTEYIGSLHESSFEGEDICDPALLHDRPVLGVEANSVYSNEIGGHRALDLSPQGLYQGIVMSEILKRPAERMGRVH